METYPGAQRVDAAKQGDQQALDELISAYLPLVYNIVGRALDGHADVDDVVQETMLRVVHGISGLRDPTAFRSWVVAIAVRETRGRRRARQSVGEGGTDELLGIADPGADFVDLTILRLGLAGQRQETAEATRWLEAADRDLLALWWLETAGQITRGDLAGALDVSAEYAAVRVQRMKAQLETARAVVRALWAAPRCLHLDEAIRDWDGHASSLWRKRLARHVRECPACCAHLEDLVPAERLLAGIALVPVTGMFAAIAARTAPLAPHWSPADPHGAPTAPAGAARRLPRGKQAGHWRLLTAKPVVVSVALTAVVAGGTMVLTGRSAPASSAPATAARTSAQSRAGALASTTVASPSTTPTTAPASPSPSATPATSPAQAAAVYGQSVDAVDSAPDPYAKSTALPHRPESKAITVASGKWEKPFKGAVGGAWLMFFLGDSETLTGRGYFSVRWEVAYFNRAPGQLRMPTWTGLSGKLFHVASGGYYRMSDEVPGATDKPHTWMGRPGKGYDTLPAGAQQMWEVEYYYLDGTVALHENENYADYNLGVSPETWQSVTDNIDTAPNPATFSDPYNPHIRFGIVRDTGDDSAPVPQYLTRAVPADSTSVAQHSRV